MNLMMPFQAMTTLIKTARHMSRFVVVWLGITVAVVGPARGDTSPEAHTTVTVSTLNELLDGGPRFIGSPGHQDAARVLERRLNELDAGRVIIHDMAQVVPVVDSAEITLEDGTQFPIYPVWPNSGRLCTTAPGGVSGPVVYVENAREKDLPTRKLAGAVVAMEYNSFDRWKQVCEFGAAAVLFLPPKTTSWVHSHGKFADIPFDAPRFFVQSEELAALIRQSDSAQEARIESRMRWSPRPVRNFIWVIEGRDAELRDQTVVFNARYDAGCVVPQLAYGAEQAVSAAALVALARSFVRDPPARTAVLIWTGADTMNFASLRAILGAARGSDKDADAALKAAIASRDTLALQHRQVLDDAREAVSTEAGVRARYELQIKHDYVPLHKLLISLRRLEDPDPQSVSRRKAIEAQTESVTKLRIALQRNRIDDAHWLQLEKLTARVMAQIDAELAEAETAVSDLDRDYRLLRPMLERKRVMALLSVDLTSQGAACGVYWQTDWLHTWVEDLAAQSLLGQRLVGRRGSTREDLALGIGRGFLTDTVSGARDWHSDINCPLATSIDIAQHFGYLSLGIITAHDGRWLVDSPLDRRERLDLANIKRQVGHVVTLAHRAANDYKFQVVNRLQVRIAAIEGRAVTLSHGDTRLNVGLPGRLVTINTARPIARVVGTRWMSAQITGALGQYHFPHLSFFQATAGAWSQEGLYDVDVVGLDGAGRIVETANQAGGLTTYPFRDSLKLGADVTGVKSVMFDCSMQSIGGLTDPRYLQHLRVVRPLLQRTGDDPRYFAMRAADGLASVMLQSREKWLMTISRGQRGIRMLMTGADEAEPKGLGFDLGTSSVSGRSSLMHAPWDFFLLNRDRLDVIARHGITSNFTVELQGDTRRHLDRAQAAYDRDDAAQARHHWRAAVAMQQVVYGHVLDTGDDVVVAVIFILLVLLPFSFYTERLLINAATVYGRIAGFVAVFMVMMVFLYSFHPAFRITTTPVIVLLAFVIIVLSGVVIFILYMRFTEQLKSRISSEHSANLSRLNVVGRAMVVGVANMRRRKIRSCFTLVTLIVMTFALLSLSGTQTQMLEKQYALTDVETGGPVRPSYQGIQVTQVGWRQLPPWFLEQVDEQVNTFYGDSARVGGQFWLLPEPSTFFEPHVIVTRDHPEGSTAYRLTAVMGVGEDEHRFLQLDAAMQKMFEQLSNDPDGCLLPREAADELRVGPGDAVRLGGRDFRVTGIFDEKAMRRLRYLTGQRYGPIDLKTYSLVNEQAVIEGKTAEQMLDPSFVKGDVLLQALSPREFALIGDDTARAMGAHLRSVCIQSDSPEILDAIAADLSIQRLVPLYRSRGDEVQIIATRRRMSIVGLGDLFIPLLIGALIVINTMINAVADQRSTIYVYTSLGLAPVHVGVLFLSEAAALGTLGVVGGFVVGQGFATVVRGIGLLDTLTLNYSSTAVMFTMALVMGIVLLSAIYPARLASRLAVPAESSRWEVPAPVGDRIRMELPFTVSELTARGASAFLYEWLSLHTEVGVGLFISDNTSVFHHEAVRGIRSSVWLTPFDLGVSQHVQIEIAPATDPQSSGQESTFYDVFIEMTRQSGQPSTWVRSTRGFIVELRKQFLLWRALNHDRQQEYAEESEKMLRASPAGS